MLRGTTHRWISVLIVLIATAWLKDQLWGQSSIWVTAYYAGWMQGWHNNGVLPAENIDYSAVTHIIHFGLVPYSDGSMNSTNNSIVPNNSSTLTSKAHAAGRKVIISVGGWGTDAGFRGATSVANRAAFINNLISFMRERGYDGIDIDWEPLNEALDSAQYRSFIKDLRDSLNAKGNYLLTAANGTEWDTYRTIHQHFDQINLMTYDMSGAWPGWVTWHNAPIYDGGFRFPSTGGPVPSANRNVDRFIEAGIPASKLGIGIDFYGYIWSGGTGTSTGGVSQPRQMWTSPPQVRANVPFHTIFRQYYQPEYYSWDIDAQAAYLNIDNAGSSDDRFISYDNEITCRTKIEYARTKGLGGVFIWELGGGQLAKDFPNRDRLLQTLKNSIDSTFDSPTVPTLTLPLNNIVGSEINPGAGWNAPQGASFYRLQLARDSSFSDIVVDQSWIVQNAHVLKNLSLNSPYYWRVNAGNAFTSSDWSQASKFTTTPNMFLPTQWRYVENTGNRGVIILPASVRPRIKRKDLVSGDIIGVFFREKDEYVGAGFNVWQDGQDLTLHAWGDNPQSVAKEGFVEGDAIVFKIWKKDTRREYHAIVAYSTGSSTYTPDASYVLSSLVGTGVDRHKIHLAKGWNTISSYVEPNEPSIDSVVSSIRSNVLFIRNAAGNMFHPDSGNNTLDTWNPLDGYQIYMKDEDTLTLIGDELSPDSVQIQLNQGWNIPSYIRTVPMQIDSALTSVAPSVALVKNNEGLVYWPAVSINTIGSMIPGQAYKIYVDQPVSLRYPPAAPRNSFLDSFSPLNAATPRTGRVGVEYGPPATGSNATLLVELSGREEGKEIIAYTEDNNVVGKGTVKQGNALIVLYGDDAHTLHIVEGARDRQHLTLEVKDKREVLTLLSVINALTDEPVSSPLVYQTDAAWIARVRQIPTEFVLEQNYPNPFNASTTISYSLPFEASVRLEIYDALGRTISTLIDEVQQAGARTVRFENPNLASGVYFYRLRAEKLSLEPQSIFKAQDRMLSQIRKMILLR